MSKTETLRQSAAASNETRLERLASQIEAVRQAKHQSAEDLAATLEPLAQAMAALPEAVAAEISTVLSQVDQAAQACDTIARLQRQTLDILAHDLAQSAMATMREQTTTLAQSIEQMRQSMTTLEASAHQASQVPERLDQAGRRMVRAADHLAQQAQALRQRQRPWWQRALTTVATAAIGGAIGAAVAVAALALSGHGAFAHVAPPSAETLAQAWQHATPAERASLREIASRRAP